MVPSRQWQKFLLLNPQQLGQPRNCRSALMSANQIGLILSFRTSQLSGFGTELSLNAKMLEVGVSNHRTTETLSALGNLLAGKCCQSTCYRRSGFSNKYHSYDPAP